MNQLPLFDPDEPQKPVLVYASPLPAVVGVFFRQLGLMGGAITTLMTLVGQRDLRGLFDYLAGHEFLVLVSMVVGLGCLLWGYIREFRVWRKLARLVDEVPDSVGTFVTKLFKWPKFWR